MADLGEDQFSIISEVLTSSMAGAPEGWTELAVRYYVEGDRSAQVATCLVDGPDGVVEEALPYDPVVDTSMRRLRDHLAQAGRPPFTEAKLSLHADGQYNVDYGYEDVDWSALLQPSWNFQQAH